MKDVVISQMVTWIGPPSMFIGEENDLESMYVFAQKSINRNLTAHLLS